MSDNTYIDWYMEKQKLQQEIEKQRKEICDKTDEIQKLQNEITDMCYDVFELQAGVKELESSNAELLVTLEACCIATQGKKKAFCECFQHDSRPCLDMEGVCWFGKNGDCHIWKAIQKERGQG